MAPIRFASDSDGPQGVKLSVLMRRIVRGGRRGLAELRWRPGGSDPREGVVEGDGRGLELPLVRVEGGAAPAQRAPQGGVVAQVAREPLAQRPPREGPPVARAPLALGVLPAAEDPVAAAGDLDPEGGVEAVDRAAVLVADLAARLGFGAKFESKVR